LELSSFFLYISQMEVIRVYNPNGDSGGLIKVRKSILPNTILTYEEHHNFPEYCNVVANGEIFIIDENYDDFTRKLNAAKLIDLDGGIQL